MNDGVLLGSPGLPPHLEMLNHANDGVLLGSPGLPPHLEMLNHVNDGVLLGSPGLPPHLEMLNHVEAASTLCDSASVASNSSTSTDDRDPLSQDIASDLGVTPLVSQLDCSLGSQKLTIN